MKKSQIFFFTTLAICAMYFVPSLTSIVSGFMYQSTLSAVLGIVEFLGGGALLALVYLKIKDNDWMPNSDAIMFALIAIALFVLVAFVNNLVSFCKSMKSYNETIKLLSLVNDEIIKSRNKSVVSFILSLFSYVVPVTSAVLLFKASKETTKEDA